MPKQFIFSSRQPHRPGRFFQSLVLATLLQASVAFAASPEDAYISARDRSIAALKKAASDKNEVADTARHAAALKALERRMKSLVEPFAAPGFAAQGKLSLESLFDDELGYGMLDGMFYGAIENDRSVLVTTDGLFDKWVVGHRNWGAKNTLPTSSAAAVKTDDFYTQAISTDAAVTLYAAVPIAAPTGAKFAYAAVSASSNGGVLSPTPDRLLVALEFGGRVFIVDAKLATPLKPIAVCDAGMKAADAKVEAAGTNAKLAEKLRGDGDAAFRGCFADKVKGASEFNGAREQAAAIVAALTGK